MFSGSMRDHFVPGTGAKESLFTRNDLCVAISKDWLELRRVNGNGRQHVVYRIDANDAVAIAREIIVRMVNAWTGDLKV